MIINGNLQRCRRRIFTRRHRNVFFVVLIGLASIHLFQTGKFLVEHFFPNQLTTINVELEMKFWRIQQETQQIPRSIHQIWISSRSKTKMKDDFSRAAQSCKQFHTNYNYTLWTHEKILLFLEDSYPWFIPIYQSYSYDMQRVDAMKYVLLFHFGGIYIDLDIRCEVADLIGSMIGKSQTNFNEPEILFHMGSEGISANTDLVAAQRFHPFFKLAISRLKSANRWFYFYHLTIILSAGPTYLYGIYRQFPIKDRFVFVPNDLLWGKLVSGIGGATWYGKDTMVLLFLVENKLLSICLLLLAIFCVTKYLKRNSSS